MRDTISDRSLISLQRADGYAIVAFNRPDRFNALVPEMLAAFEEVMAELDADPGVSVAVLTGRGRAFCAGLDVSVLETRGPSAFAGFNPAATIAAWKGPVIAAINGAAATGGFEITVACDIILAGESGRFVDTHSRVGLLPGWGLSARLHRAIGIYRAKELEMTGRSLPAREAEAWGLVNHVVPDERLLAEARALAASIVAGAPGMPSAMKHLIDGVSRLSLAEALEFERETSAAGPGQTSAELDFTAFRSNRR